LELILRGPAAEDALESLAMALADARVTLTARPLSKADSATDKTIDPVAVAAVVVSIPIAVLAVLDVMHRIAKRRRAKELVAAAGRLRVERRVEVLAVTPEGSVALADMDPDALLELIAQERQGGKS
jgi:ABC-type sulfate transport system permease component